MNNIEDLIRELKDILDEMLEASLKGRAVSAFQAWSRAERLLLGGIRTMIAGDVTGSK